MTYSVVIPAYNAAQTIQETLQSVVEQSICAHEIIVIDDGSSDDTAAIVAKFPYPIKLLRQANQGCGAATSAGFRVAREPIIATIDADDVWLKQKMERQLGHLYAHPECAVVCSKVRQFHHNHPDRINGRVTNGLLRSTMVMRKQVYELVGDVIDPPGNRGDMIDWLARCREQGFSISILPEILCLRRILENSLSYARDSEKDRGYLDVVRRAMLRRRATAMRCVADED